MGGRGQEGRGRGGEGLGRGGAREGWGDVQAASAWGLAPVHLLRIFDI